MAAGWAKFNCAIWFVFAAVVVNFVFFHIIIVLFYRNQLNCRCCCCGIYYISSRWVCNYIHGICITNEIEIRVLRCCCFFSGRLNTTTNNNNSSSNSIEIQTHAKWREPDVNKIIMTIILTKTSSLTKLNEHTYFGVVAMQKWQANEHTDTLNVAATQYSSVILLARRV